MIDKETMETLNRQLHDQGKMYAVELLDMVQARLVELITHEQTSEILQVIIYGHMAMMFSAVHIAVFKKAFNQEDMPDEKASLMLSELAATALEQSKHLKMWKHGKEEPKCNKHD